MCNTGWKDANHLSVAAYSLRPVFSAQRGHSGDELLAWDVSRWAQNPRLYFSGFFLVHLTYIIISPQTLTHAANRTVNSLTISRGLYSCFLCSGSLLWCRAKCQAIIFFLIYFEIAFLEALNTLRSVNISKQRTRQADGHNHITKGGEVYCPVRGRSREFIE